ncbi:MAG: hypothetical protein ACLQPD_18535 [Desulfomonilaceae bacterium]
MSLLDAKQDYAKARQMITEADKTMAVGEKELSEAQRVDVKLLQDIRRSEEAGRKMMIGAKLMRNGVTMLMKDEKAVSTAHKIAGEGQGILDRVQKTVSQL